MRFERTRHKPGWRTVELETYAPFRLQESALDCLWPHRLSIQHQLKGCPAIDEPDGSLSSDSHRGIITHPLLFDLAVDNCLILQHSALTNGPEVIAAVPVTPDQSDVGGCSTREGD
ncbi:MAG: hypothetical protein R2854_02835 [Caldilineaceae bacterium]